MPALQGSCLCGGVKFEIGGPLIAPSNCHCSLCRKQHGAAFRSRARVRAAISNGYRVRTGDVLQIVACGFRGFCRVCGSPVIKNSAPARR